MLGDTQIATPKGILRDDTIGQFAQEQRAAYRERLHAGRGYDDEHRALVTALQNEQARHRNRRGGYWIAEPDPVAARQALTKQLSVAEVPWLVLATDGAYRPTQMLSLDRWTQVSGCDSGELATLGR